eukprot:85360-Amphidinium_carterae.1
MGAFDNVAMYSSFLNMGDRLPVTVLVSSLCSVHFENAKSNLLEDIVKEVQAVGDNTTTHEAVSSIPSD